MSSLIRCKIGCLLIAVGLLAAAGCGEEVEPLEDGSLALSWEVSPRGCADAGVEMIDVRLEHGQRSYEERFACAEGEGRVEGIAPAKYDLTLIGLDRQERETFASDTERVTVNAEQIREAPHLRLTAKPATLEVEWRFGNGRVCGANDVSRVEVALYDPAYYELGRDTFDCDSGSGVIGGLVAGDFIVEAVAEGGDDVFHGFADASLKRGEEGSVDVTLDVVD